MKKLKAVRILYYIVIVSLFALFLMTGITALDTEENTAIVNETIVDEKSNCTEPSKCSCGAKDHVGEVMVWIPVKGGKKYHDRSSCSGMVDPIQVTQSEAIRRGFGVCGRCY